LEREPHFHYESTQDIGTEYECETCGYNKWDIGLEFHHVRDGHMLLCAPCHRSYHTEVVAQYSRNGQRFDIFEEESADLYYWMRRHKCHRDNSSIMLRLFLHPFHKLDKDGATRWFQDRGGYCDCEVLLNVVMKYMMGKKTKEIIHLAKTTLQNRPGQTISSQRGLRYPPKGGVS